MRIYRENYKFYEMFKTKFSLWYKIQLTFYLQLIKKALLNFSSQVAAESIGIDIKH